MMEEIFGCPHEEGIDYPVGEECPECPYWANRPRPVVRKQKASLTTGIATYKPEQWQELLASAEDRDNLQNTWDEWYATSQKVMKKMEAEGMDCVRVPVDVAEIKRYCAEKGVPNNGAARAELARLKLAGEVW